MEKNQNDEFMKLQEELKQSDLSEFMKREMQYLCRLIEKKANKYNCPISEVVLRFPNDCNNFDVFFGFARFFKCSFAVIDDWKRCYKIYNICQGYNYLIIDMGRRIANEQADARFAKKKKNK